MTEPIKFANQSVRKHFGSVKSEKYFDDLVDIIKEKAPDYSMRLKEILLGNSISVGNMLIMRRDYFNEYVEFVSDVLFKYKKSNINN